MEYNIINFCRKKLFTFISFTSNCLRRTVWLAGTSPIRHSTFSVKADRLCGFTSALNFSFNAKNITMYCSYEWNGFLRFILILTINKNWLTRQKCYWHLINEDAYYMGSTFFTLHYMLQSILIKFWAKPNYILERKIKVNRDIIQNHHKTHVSLNHVHPVWPHDLDVLGHVDFPRRFTAFI